MSSLSHRMSYCALLTPLLMKMGDDKMSAWEDKEKGMT